MNKTELTAIINALETAHRAVANSTNRPADTARHFIAAVGIDTAAQCVAAMVRRAQFDGRISKSAKDWANALDLSADWGNHISYVYSNAIHPAHLSQIAEAMPLEIDYAVALQESQANNQQNDDASAVETASRPIFYAVERTGTGTTARYCIKSVRWNGTDPTPLPAYPTEQAALAAAETHGIQISAMGDLYELLTAYRQQTPTYQRG